MDILASVLAYVGCMTGIVGALAISFVIVMSPPAPSPDLKQAIVKQAAVKQPAPAVAKSAAPVVTTTATAASVAAQPGTTAGRGTHIAPAIAADPADRQKTATTSRHSKMLAARAQKMRRFVQEERARRWAYQQDADFEARFLGYAD